MAVACTAKGQIFEEEFKDCKDPQRCLYCGDTIAMPTTSLTKYFKRKIEHAPYGYDAKYGKINFELYVDSTGHPCVISIEDRGLNWQLKNDFRVWLGEMKEWRPAIRNGRPINSNIILQADTHREWFSVGLISPAKVRVAKKIAKHQEFTLRSARENGDTSNNIMANIDLSLSAPDYDLKEFIRKNIQYPEIAAKNGIQGIVIVSFMVAEDGKIEYVTTIQGLGGGCTEEAIRIVKLMPPWKLANSHGRPVRAYTQLHFNF